MPIASATYDAATRTVTLVPTKRLYLFDEYLLVVKGTGPNAIIDVNGVALDGKANGQPGSDYLAVFGQQNLAGPAPGTQQQGSHLPERQVGPEAGPDASRARSNAGKRSSIPAVPSRPPRDREAPEQRASTTAHDPEVSADTEGDG